MRKLRILSLILVGVLVLGACGPKPTETPTAGPPTQEPPPADLKEITLLLPYIRSQTFYSVFVADALGYYEAEGLDVTVEPGDGGSFAVQQVLAGQVEVGMANPGAVILAVTEGNPVKWFYTDKAANLFGIAALADSPINTPEDLEGKILGITDLSGGEMPMTNAVLVRAGLTPGDNVELLPIGDVPATAVEALQSGKIDAYAASQSEFVPMESHGIALKSINYPEYDNLVSEGLFVTPETLESDPDMVAGLGRAVAKASFFCESSPGACLAVMKELVPEEHDDVEAAWRFFESVVGQHAFTIENGEYVFGAHNPDSWDLVVQMLAMSEEGVEDVDISDIIVDDYVDDFNDFDRAAIQAEAQAYAAANPYPAKPSAEMPSGELREITLLLPFIRTIGFYPWLIADELGFFAEEGLAVDIQPTDGSSFVVQQVAAGRAEAGLAGAGAILNGMEEGLPFQDVMRWMWTQTFPLITSGDTGITSIEGLRGKVVGISEAGGGDVPALEAYLRSEGLEPRVDVDLLPVGEDVPTLMQAFESGQIAAYSSSWNRNISFRAAGFEVVELTPDAFKTLPAEDIVVPATLAEEEPELVAAICRATAKGMLVGLENPAAALAAMQKVVPEEHDDTLYAWLYMEAAQETVRPPMTDGQYYLGEHSFDDWQALADLSAEGAFELGDFLTNDFVDETNDFDYDGLIQKAAAYAAANPYPAKPGAEMPPGELREITLLLPFIRTIGFYPWLIADELGFFAEEGLAVDIQPTDGSSFVVQQVAAGRAEAGLAGAGAILNGMEEGLPFQDVMRWMWTQTFPLITSGDTGITSIEGLRGKVVGISEAGGGDVPALEAYLRSEGLEPRVDVDLLPVGEDVPTLMQAFESGQIAAYSSSWNRNISFRAAGFEVVELTPDAFKTLPAEDIVVPATLAEEEPELVAAICRATAKGMLVGLENPAAALAAMQKVVPEEHDDTAYAWLYMEAAQETVRPPMQGGKYVFGEHSFDDWQALADLSAEKAFELGDFLTNDFVDEINAFDYDNLIDGAADYARANPYPEP